MKKLYLLLILPLLSSYLCFSQDHENHKYVAETDPLVLKKLEHWQDIKFGLLMHWGAYCQWGVVESWSICAEDEGWCQRKTNNYQEYKKKYEKLQTTFNPTAFDPEKWARAAQRAGMKYIVFTTKHHDGFCMFDTQYSDYKITSPQCPFHTNDRADIAGEIFKAFRNHDFMIGAYFSKPDWHSEYYWWPNFATPDRNVNYDPYLHPDRWSKFVEFTHNQILELMTNYGKMDILWLDGGWVAKTSPEEIQKWYIKKLYGNKSGFLKHQIINQDIKMDELVRKCRQKQPGLIVVDRAVYGKNQNYLTPENRVPDKTLPYPWESCIISGGGWSYTPDAKYMSGREGIHMLIDIVAKGGNLLLNIAPGPDGRWQQGAYDLLKEYAQWMQVNGQAIYNSTPIAPYKENNICMTKQSNGDIYYMYMASKDEIQMPEQITIKAHNPASDARISILGVNGKLKWKKLKEGFTVFIPQRIRNNPPCKYAWTIKVSKPK